MKVLITGATGFLGSAIARRLAGDGHDLRVLVRPESNQHRLDGLRAERMLGDVMDPASVRAAVQGRECVIHAAADVNYWGQNPERQMKVNVVGTANVASACRAAGVRRLAHVSSVGAIGIPTTPARPADEEFQFNLDGSGLVYHVSKKRAEQQIAAEVERGLDAVIVNPASITGAGRLAGLLRSVRRSVLTPCFSGGNCVVDVDDVADGVIAALKLGVCGNRYILGGENLTFRAMSEKAAHHLELRRMFVVIPPLATGIAAAVCEPWARRRNRAPKFSKMIHYCANRFLFYDSTKARNALGYRPRDFDGILRKYLKTACGAVTA